MIGFFNGALCTDFQSVRSYSADVYLEYHFCFSIAKDDYKQGMQ